MKLQPLTLEDLLNNSEVRSVNFEHNWYFSINDLSRLYPGIFKNVSPVPLPLKVKEGRQMTNCMNFNEIVAILEKV